MRYEVQGNLYIIKANSDQIAIQTGVNTEVLGYDNKEMSMMVTDFSFSGQNDGEVIIRWIMGHIDKTLKFSFVKEHEENFALLSNFIAYSKYKPDDGNLSFVTGIGGSLEVRDDKIIISRDREFPLYPWARELESRVIPLNRLKGIGLLRTGMLTDGLVQGIKELGCIRFLDNVESSDCGEWHPLTDPNTIIFDKRNERAFYKAYMLLRINTEVETLKFDLNNTEIINYKVNEQLHDMALAYRKEVLPTKVLKLIMKDYTERVNHLYRKDFITNSEADFFEKSFPDNVEWYSINESLLELQNPEIEKLNMQWRRGLLNIEHYDEARNEILRDFMESHGLKRDILKEEKFKLFELFEEILSEKSREKALLELVHGGQEGEMNNPKKNVRDQERKPFEEGKVIHLPKREE